MEVGIITIVTVLQEVAIGLYQWIFMCLDAPLRRRH
jgi:hypothetical protein